jgi:hypothetical protein
MLIRTRPEGAAMSKLHSQLALFGAIDQEVVDAKDRLKQGAEGDGAATDAAVIDMVEKFLPGTTRFGQHGWYAELVTYLTTVAAAEGSAQLNFPDLGQALNELAEGGTEEEDDRDPALARAAYAAVVLEKIYLRTGVRTDDHQPLRILVRALRGWPQEPENDPVEELTKRIDDISNRQEWVTQVRQAAGREFAERSLPCFGSLRKVDGQYCAYITTDSIDKTLGVKDIAKIVEPLNWNSCCKFFCKMTPQKFNGAGWNRVIERISGECDEYYLDTALVFWKEQRPDGSIFINYDLDTDRTGDSGLVEVDSGYIWITPLQPKGVRIRTSKLERVSGLSPTATAALACLMGWGDTGHEMLAGTARKYMNDPTQPPGMKPFRRSPNDQYGYKE